MSLPVKQVMKHLSVDQSFLGKQLESKTPELAQSLLNSPKTSMAASVVLLLKAIMGAGVLALPHGVAAFSDTPAVGLPIGVAIMGVAGVFSAYSFWLIGRLCVATETSTYMGAFGKIYGERCGKVVCLLVNMYTGTLAFNYTIIVADTARDLSTGLGASGVFSVRELWLGLISPCILLPLALLPSLKALAPFSVLGVLGVLYTVAICVVRYLQGCYAEGGEFSGVVPAPVFGTRGIEPMPAFVLTSMLACAYMSHYNAPRFVGELHNPTMPRFALLCFFGFGGAFLVMGSMMTFGFLTFGGSSRGFILNNYSVQDKLAATGRLGILLSIVITFPLALQSCRDGLLEFLGIRKTKSQVTTFTVILVLLATAVGMFVDNLGLMVALFGALLGTPIIFVFPTLMLIGHLRPKLRSGEASATEKWEYYVNHIFVVIGVALSVTGVVIVLSRA